MYSFPSLPLFIQLFNFFNSFVLVLLLLTANLWLIFKFTVSLANKSDELNMKKITIAIDGFSSCGKSTPLFPEPLPMYVPPQIFSACAITSFRFRFFQIAGNGFQIMKHAAALLEYLIFLLKSSIGDGFASAFLCRFPIDLQCFQR